MLPVTIDEQAWPYSDSKQIVKIPENGFGLFNYSDTDLFAVVTSTKSTLVAYDIPLSYANFLSSTFGIHPLNMDVTNNPKWNFAGYDSADIRTISSAFYGHPWGEQEAQQIETNLSLSFNDFGLLDIQEKCIHASIYFSSRMPWHAPFVPCGVWIWH
ncbi:hypothetical protein [Megalodesulfovibrio paquesii]